MSCFPEAVYAVYADGELSAEERRPVDSHLVGCRRCRQLVVALREEAELLSDVLHERPIAGSALAPTPADMRGIALGLGPVLAVGLTLMTVLGWLLETALPTADRWIAPFTLRGATDMAFETIFLLRDRAPAAFEVGLAVAAMASASALLTFALTMVLRRWQGPGLMMLALPLALMLPAAEGRAHFGLHEHEDFTLPAGETHDGTLVVSGNSVSVDGDVDGDVVAFARRVTIRGEVRGNLITITRQLEVPGHVAGSVHAGAGRIHVAGAVDGNLYAFTEGFTLSSSGTVARDAAVLSESAVLEGAVGRDLFLGGDRSEIRGPIGRNVTAWIESLALLDGARIEGSVQAWMPDGSQVEVASGARIGGEVVSKELEMHPRGGLSRYTEPRFYVWLAVNLAAAFLAGMLLHLLLPALFEVRAKTGPDILRSLAVGFVVLVAMPAALLLCAVTLVGIPVALMGLALYLASLYVGSIVVAALVGVALVRPRGEGSGPFGLALLAGLALTFVAANTPFVGVLVKAVVVLLGLGLLTERARTGWRAVQGLPA